MDDMIKVMEENENGEVKYTDRPVSDFLIRDMKRWNNDFTEIVASRLHYFDHVDKVDLNTCTAKEIIDIQSGWVDRYRNDPIFNAKVNSIVAQLMQAIDD